MRVQCPLTMAWPVVAVSVLLFQQSQIQPSGLAVQIGHRFVREDQTRFHDERPGNGNPLPLTARELRGPPVEMLFRQFNLILNHAGPAAVVGREPAQQAALAQVGKLGQGSAKNVPQDSFPSDADTEPDSRCFYSPRVSDIGH